MTISDLIKIVSSIDSKAEVLQVCPVYDEYTHELKDVWVAARDTEPKKGILNLRNLFEGE